MRDVKPINLLSVVIPIYNKQQSLPELIHRTRVACDPRGLEYEILLVDDDSSDRSAELIEQAAAVSGSPVIGVLLNRNYAQHSAIMAGFSHVRGDLIVTLDADLQNPLEEIPRLVDAARQGYAVLACRCFMSPLAGRAWRR